MSRELVGRGTNSDPYIIETIDDFLSISETDAHYELHANLDFSNYGSEESTESDTQIDHEESSNFLRNGGLLLAAGTFLYTRSVVWTFVILIGLAVVLHFRTDSDSPSSFNRKYPGSGFVETDELHATIFDGEEFTGEFNGNGHEICSVTFMVNNDSGGLFNDIGEGGVVHNLRVRNVELLGDAVVGVIAGINNGLVGSVRVSNSTIVGGEMTGSVVGMNRGLVSQCISEGCTVSGGRSVGGFCGGNRGYIHESEVMDVECICDDNRTEKKICGGFLGITYRDSLIVDCRAEGCITVEAIDGGTVKTGEFAGINGDFADRVSAGVLLNSFASVEGCEYGFAAHSQYPILNCYYNQDVCEGEAYYSTTWIHDLPVRGLSESAMTGEAALSNMDWLNQDVWESSDELPRQKRLNRLDAYWNASSERVKAMLGNPADVSRLKSVEEWAEELHATALDSPAVTNDIPESAKSRSHSSSSRTSASSSNGSSNGSSSSRGYTKTAIKSTGGLLSSGTTIGYIEGDTIRGAGGLLTRGKIVAELDGDTVRDTSGLLTSGDPIAKIDGDTVRDIGGLLSSGDILAVIDGNDIRDKGGILSSGDRLAKIDGSATQEQKGAAAAAIVLGKIKE